VTDERLLGDIIREARVAKGMTLRMLATAIGCSAPFLSDVEHGRRTPLRHINQIAEILGLDSEELRHAKLRYSVEAVRRRYPEVAELLDELRRTAPVTCPCCVRY
jgi:transcriptional regulator with XRE-family HTH domain